MSLHFENFFNEDTLNIFTDASVKVINNITLSAPGAVCVITKGKDTYILDEDFDERNIVYNSTNNDGEIRAVYLGVYYAIKYQSMFKYINLFSDSNVCIQGLSQWIFSWVKNINNNRLYNSSGTQVANQDIISALVNTIIEKELSINFYHQKGHVKISDKGFQKCFNDFLKTNRINRSMDKDILECISVYNDYVDVKTKETLNKYSSIYYNNGDMIKPFEYTIKANHMNEYKKLIKRRKL